MRTIAIAVFVLATSGAANAQTAVTLHICRAPGIVNTFTGRDLSSPAGVRFVAFTRIDHGTPTGPMIELGLSSPVIITAKGTCADGAAEVISNPTGQPLGKERGWQFHEAGLTPDAQRRIGSGETNLAMTGNADLVATVK